MQLDKVEEYLFDKGYTLDMHGEGLVFQFMGELYVVTAKDHSIKSGDKLGWFHKLWLIASGGAQELW